MLAARGRVTRAEHECLRRYKSRFPDRQVGGTSTTRVSAASPLLGEHLVNRLTTLLGGWDSGSVTLAAAATRATPVIRPHAQPWGEAWHWSPLDLVGLSRLMERVPGSPSIAVALLDGPVRIDHPELAQGRITAIDPRREGCAVADGAACVHGTFVAGLLSGRRGGTGLGICAGCRLLVRPIFAEGAGPPRTTAQLLAAAVVAAVDAGARVINLSAALVDPTPAGERILTQALRYAANRRVITVAAAGNGGAVGGSVITRHPWVIPVAACDATGRPTGLSNLGISIGRSGVRAPGARITGIGPASESLTLDGTSVAAPFVTGTLALLFSAYPAAPAADLLAAVSAIHRLRKSTIVPPLLDAWSSFCLLARRQQRAGIAA